MVRFYKRPILLIEFDPNKSFSLQVSIHRNPVVKIKLASKCPSSNFQVSITVEHERAWIWNFSWSVQLDSSRVRCRVEHKNRNIISTNNYVLFCLSYQHNSPLLPTKVDFING